MNTLIKTGIIGPKDYVDSVLELQSRFFELDLMGFPYLDESETIDIYEKIKDTVDIVVLLPLPYLMVLKKKPTIPIVAVNHGDTALYRALFLAKETYDLERLSFDTISRRTIEDAYRELGLNANMLFVKEYNVDIPISELVEFHSALFQEKKISAVFTCSKKCYEILKSRNIPCERVIPTKTAIVQALERALFLGENLKSKENHILVAHVNIDNFKSIIKDKSEYDIQKIKLDIQRCMLDYIEEVDGFLVPQGNDDFVLVTTRGMFEAKSNSYNNIPLFHKLKDIIPTTISIGVGMGHTANKAELNARVALKKAKDNGGDSCFVMFENQKLVGPIGGKRIEYETKTINPNILNYAQNTGLSASILTEVLSSIEALNQDSFTAEDLVPILGKSLRHVHRQIKKLLEVGLISVTGQEKVNNTGRPRVVYKLERSKLF